VEKTHTALEMPFFPVKKKMLDTISLFSDFHGKKILGAIRNGRVTQGFFGFHFLGVWGFSLRPVGSAQMKRSGSKCGTLAPPLRELEDRLFSARGEGDLGPKKLGVCVPLFLVEFLVGLQTPRAARVVRIPGGWSRLFESFR